MEDTTKEPFNNGEMMVQRDKKGRILPGSVLNPVGKPKGTKHLSTLLFDKLSEASNNGLIAEKDVIIQKVIDMAKDGNMRAIELIWERMEGKSTQVINQISQTEVLTEEQKERLDNLLR